MIDYENIRKVVINGLESYLNAQIVRSNQDAEMPPYPFIAYTVTTPMTQNRGTYGEYDDGIARKPVQQIWSITALSDKEIESVTLANKAREWLDYVGKTYLDDNNVKVQSVTSVGNRDNLVTIGYEYRNGFDVFFNVFDEIKSTLETDETIETITINNEVYEIENTDDLIEQLEQRLDGEN